MNENVQIAVIGGSGLYNMPEISDKTRLDLDTPYGAPSTSIVVGTLRGKRVAFLPRHGEGHVHTPSTVPYRANIYALKKLGVRFIISVNAAGSLKEAIAPGHLVIPDQLYDNTRSERSGRSFFESGIVAHISVADPFCLELAQVLHGAAVDAASAQVHKGGTLVVIEGPRFSTKAESHVYRQLGFAVIGMTTAPEAFLAREAEIAYAAIVHITDYDVWHEEEDAVSTELVLETLKKNLTQVQQTLAQAVERLDEAADFPSHHALDGAVMTMHEKRSPALAAHLALLLGER